MSASALEVFTGALADDTSTGIATIQVLEERTGYIDIFDIHLWNPAGVYINIRPGCIIMYKPQI